MKKLKSILLLFLIVIAFLLVGLIGLILYAMASDYKPDQQELIARPDNPAVLKDSLILSLLTWNIGYAGLDKDMDFFKDGGTKVITPRDKCLENISGIIDFLEKNDTVDFILLQEIDVTAKEVTGSINFRNCQKKYPAIIPSLRKIMMFFSFLLLPPGLWEKLSPE